LAPTGRAAKVFSRYAGYPAYTIHRRIYRSPAPGQGQVSGWGQRAENKSVDTLFVVDEASMIGGNDGFSGSVLEDLVSYVYSGAGCRLILLGDTAQLPPVGTTSSPALDPKVLIGMGLKVTRVVMTETVRQHRRSGILYNATVLRKMMRLEPLVPPILTVTPFGDVVAVDPVDLDEIMERCYNRGGLENTLMITRSNRRAVEFNLAIRSRILDREEELCRGDLLLVAKNNYFWSAGVKELDFIANGDIVEVIKIFGTESRGGLRFADLRLRFVDRDVELDCKIVLDSLTSDSPSLQPDKQDLLAKLVVEDEDRFAPDVPYESRLRSLKTDAYFNALQVKFAYAVTCHKAQGGQWENVFVDMGYIPPEAYTEPDLYRWLYTATTRATECLYYVNPSVEVK
ncbi:MAG: ATP-binding domain-containing protein, partial [Muribaculaceae bacterium]|nr:ATP-binding domain-containing protein [Muribaculaceae bacterium]